MDPTLTRAAAHKVFGDLYRKTRPPDLQEKVDRVIQATSDVFVRIQRIEELDADHARGKKGVETAAKRPQGRSPGAAPAARPARKPERKAGILDALLGGGDIGVWGKETETLTTGFLGRNLKLSKKSEDIFTALNEEIVVAAIKCFRTATRVGWQVWEPATYNVVVTAYQFFNEFVNAASILKRNERPETLAQETAIMQKMYGALVQYPNYKRVLGESFVKLVLDSKEMAGYTDLLKLAVNHIVNLEARNPTLKNTILAFHALSRKQIVSWQDVMQELGVGKPVLNRYRAPEAIMQQIDGAIKKHETQIDLRIGEIQEIENLKRSFFDYDSAGKVKTEFLNKIVYEVLRRIYNEKVLNEGTLKQHKTEPPRLLFVILKDFDISSLYLLEGSFHIKDPSGQAEMILFKQGLWRTTIDEFNAVLREVEMFYKKNKNLTFNFQNLIEIMKSGHGDEEMKKFLALVGRANRLFKLLVTNFRIIWDNHQLARKDQSQASQEKLARTKTIPIEAFVVGKRYLPFYEHEIVSNNRWHGLSIEAVVGQITRNLYNYLFIFRDDELLGHLSSISRLQSDIDLHIAALKKLGIERAGGEGAPGPKSD